MKHLHVLLSLLVINSILAQDKSQVCFDVGVAAFQRRNYALADSLFTESLLLEPHKDTYFSRAATRLKLFDKLGYCSDLAHAAVLGDEEATSLFKKECGNVSIDLVDKENNVVTDILATNKLIKYENKYDGSIMATQLDLQNNYIKSFYIIKDTSRIIDDSSAVIPEFPGGKTNLAKWLQRNIQYPSDARENGIQGEVHVRFVIEKNGYATNFKVLKGIYKCPSCSAAALKALENMPLWKPGLYKGEPARIYYNMPISFKIQ